MQLVLEDLKRPLEDQSLVKEELTSETAKLKESIEERLKTNKDESADIKTLKSYQEECNSLRAKETLNQEKLNSLTEQLDQLNEENERLKKKFQRATVFPSNAPMAKSESVSSELQPEVKIDADAVSKKMVQAMQENEKLKQELDALRPIAEDRKSERDKLRQECTQLRSQVDRLHHEVSPNFYKKY